MQAHVVVDFVSMTLPNIWCLTLTSYFKHKYISSLSKDFKNVLVGVLQLKITGFSRMLKFVFYLWFSVQVFKNNITCFSKTLQNVTFKVTFLIYVFIAQFFCFSNIILKILIQCTTQNMREYGFSLTRILPYKDKFSQNPYSHLFYAVIYLSLAYERIHYHSSS